MKIEEIIRTVARAVYATIRAKQVPSQTINGFLRKRIFVPLSLVASLAATVAVAEPNTPPPPHESIEWCDIWISHANETNLPRVLLIGDSITRDYYPEVEKQLAGKAFVARLSTSRFMGDPVLLKEIELVLDETKFDVIHFNNGMHGWQHSEAEYRNSLPKVLRAIRAHAQGAMLIWATTTPLRDGKGTTYDSGIAYSNERIAARNAIAAKIVTAQNIPIDDLNAAMRDHPEYHSDNVHFNTQGIQIQAAQVSGEVEKLLP
jgi:lysophospholipase L1-like esterase